MHKPDPIPALECRRCGESLYRTHRGILRHGQLCGAMLRNVKEPCARQRGHGYEHRSAYALANAARRWGP